MNAHESARGRRWLGTLAAAVGLAAAALGLAAAGCSKDSGGAVAAPVAPPVPVTVAPVVQRPTPVEILTFGWVEPNLTAAVKSQITGLLQKVHFREGQHVKEGEPLFSIDPRPFEAALKQAQANLDRDKAQHENAQKEADRQQELLKKGVASQGEFDTAKAALDALAATLSAGQAAIDNAKLQLGYCSIPSPIEGRAGAWLVDQGNLVKANDVSLVVINQVQPIQVSFSVVKEYLQEIKTQMAGHKLEVRALIPGQESQPEIGELSFVDNQVDQSTGQIRLKATFANTRERLWPGLYVNVALVLSMQQDAILIPSRALQSGQKGMYVFVVKPDQKVEDRVVTIERTFDSESIISAGLKPGEQVVVDGQLRLTPGARAAIKSGVGEKATRPAAAAAETRGPSKGGEAPKAPETPKATPAPDVRGAPKS